MEKCIRNRSVPCRIRFSLSIYRGITILSCYGKLFTAILDYRLNYYIENMNILCEEYAGFQFEMFSRLILAFDSINMTTLETVTSKLY